MRGPPMPSATSFGQRSRRLARSAPPSRSPEAAPAHAFGVETAPRQRMAVDHHERRHVLRDVALETDHRVRADANELQEAALAADDRQVAELDVAGQPRVAGDDRLVADLAIVRDVDVVHDPVVVADAGDAGVLHGADVDRAELADRVAVADLERGVLAAVLLVLRYAADRVELRDPVVAADRRAALDHAVRPDDGARADANAGAHDAVGADFDVAGQLRAGLDDRRRVNARHAPYSTARTAHINAASTAVSPSTLARAWNLKIIDFMRSSVTSRIIWSPGSTGRLKRAESMPAK